MTAVSVQKELKNKASLRRAKVSRGFFKTGPGEYGEGDLFLGVTVPESRKIALRFSGISFSEIKKLLQSPVHEERLVAILILVRRYQESGPRIQKRVFDFYVTHLRYVNSWDLVDASAHLIVGRHLEKKNRGLLCELARSEDLWKRRVAIVSTLHFIRSGDACDTFRLAKLLLNDSHDLIHKAAGWMLRETGRYGFEEALETFLKDHSASMPRTMLRYAIERFPEKKRLAYLGRISFLRSNRALTRIRT